MCLRAGTSYSDALGSLHRRQLLPRVKGKHATTTFVFLDVKRRLDRNAAQEGTVSRMSAQAQA
jgi:hypothetical protein